MIIHYISAVFTINNIKHNGISPSSSSQTEQMIIHYINEVLVAIHPQQIFSKLSGYILTRFCYFVYATFPRCNIYT